MRLEEPVVTESTPLCSLSPRPRSSSTTTGHHHHPPQDHHGEELHVTFDPALGLVEDDDDDDMNRHHNLLDDDDDDDHDGPSTPRSRERSGSFAESITDMIVETFEEVREVIGEGLSEIKEEIVEVYEEPILPVKPREEGDHSQKLSALALAVLVFYKVSGGPFGCEPSIRAAGPFYGLLGFIVFPFVWCIQEGLVTAELGSAYPEPSGAIAWVEEAFGPQAGLLCGYFHWVSGATDNAIYPSLFLEYVASFVSTETNFDILQNESMRFFFCVCMTTLLAIINYTGLEIVGNLSIVIAVLSMSPFLLLCLVGFPQLDTSRWMVRPQPITHLAEDDIGASWLPDPVWLGVLWRPFLNNLFWNVNSFDVGASFAGEVRDPERVFPRAMFLSIIFVSLSYILPLLAALGAVDTVQDDWKAGYLATLSTTLGGHWLGAWTVFASAISNIALFEAEMSGDAYQLMGMADRGLIPQFFRKRSRFGTPTNGILVGTFVIFLLSVASFDQLVEMLNFAYCLSMLMEFAAFIKLRITDADVHRPYKIPLSTTGCVIFVIPPCLLCVYLMFIASRITYLYFAMLVTAGMLFHIVQKVAKHHHWWDYAQPPIKKKKQQQQPASTSAATAV